MVHDVTEQALGNVICYAVFPFLLISFFQPCAGCFYLFSSG